MMKIVRFAAIELNYGCHSTRFTFTNTDRPVVIAGPNGSGKTTLIEAAVRTLYGFNRRSVDDRERCDARQPWDETPPGTTLELLDDEGGRWSLTRDFRTGNVELNRADGSESWSGDGNPGSSNVEARQYRERLRGLIGLDAREAYVTTACVHQGALQDTRLDEDLLRTAAGGHGNVESAKAHIEERHRRLTKRSITPDGHDAIKDRELEEIERQIVGLDQRLETARRWQEERAPLLEETRELEGRLDRVKQRISLLETADGLLSEKQRLDADVERLESRIDEFERIDRELDDVLDDLRDANAAWADIDPSERYPEDFGERAAAIQKVWGQRLRLRDRRERANRPLSGPVKTSALGIGTVVLLAGAAVLLWVSRPILSAAVGLLGAVVAGGYFWARRRDQERRAWKLLQRELEAEDQEIEKELTELLDGVPHADTLTPDTLPDRLARYRRQRAVRERLEEARTRVREVVRRATALEHDAAEEAASPVPEPAELAPAGAALREQIGKRLSDVRTRLARRQLEFDEATHTTVDLPDGVAAEPETVKRALVDSRAERDRLDEELGAVRERLSEHGSVDESPVALERRLKRLRERRDQLVSKVESHQAAYALLVDAYDSFRERDQERFVEKISNYLDALTDGAIGPLEVPVALADAEVRMYGRRVPFRSPPLSHGEFHTALFAARLGAADFLSATGVLPPVIVDEPFAQLDLERARSLWDLLCTIAEQRQVIIATQERLTLERLGVAPDIELSASSPFSAEAADSTESGEFR